MKRISAAGKASVNFLNVTGGRCIWFTWAVGMVADHPDQEGETAFHPDSWEFCFYLRAHLKLAHSAFRMVLEPQIPSPPLAPELS